jgi:hypothetical protein
MPMPQLRLLFAGFPLQQLGFDPKSGDAGQNGTGQVSSKQFSFSCLFSFHELLHIHSHPVIYATQSWY